MAIFKTEIVQTPNFSWPVRILAGLFLIGGGYFLFMYEGNLHPYIKLLFGIGYFSGFIVALWQPFRRSKTVGSLEMDASEIKAEIYNEKRSFSFSEVKDLTLKYKGYGSWWGHSIYGNKNYLVLTTEADEKLEMEILIKNREHKKLLKEILSAHARLVTYDISKTGRTAF